MYTRYTWFHFLSIKSEWEAYPDYGNPNRGFDSFHFFEWKIEIHRVPTFVYIKDPLICIQSTRLHCTAALHCIPSSKCKSLLVGYFHSIPLFHLSIMNMQILGTLLYFYYSSMLIYYAWNYFIFYFVGSSVYYMY